MRNTPTILAVISAMLLLICSCQPQTTNADKVQSISPSIIPPPSPTGQAAAIQTPEPIVDQPTPIESAPAETPKKEPAKTSDATSGTTIKFSPIGEFKDEDLVKTMSILKIELAVKPELKVTSVERTGIGKDQQILVKTDLSQGTPVIAAVNALVNREKFQGRFDNKVLFDNNDLRFVCRIPACAGVEDMSVCASIKEGYSCTWAFGIVLLGEAAQQLEDETRGKPTMMDQGEEVIAEPINLYLGDTKIDYVYVPANMTGEPITDLTITGNGTGPTQKEAQAKAVIEMDKIRDKMSKKILPLDLKAVE